MNYNTILFRCGLSPENFKNSEINPIINSKGEINFFLEQSLDDNVCPLCESNNNVIVHDYYNVKINVTINSTQPEYLIVKKVRFKCKKCNTSFVPKLVGIGESCRISNYVKRHIYLDFDKTLTFSQISEMYQVSEKTVVNLFDDLYPIISREKLGEVLCIDEFKFSKIIDQKYCCILVDFQKKKVIDIIKNRQIAYLNEYFNKIPDSERNIVKYFVSDMYKPYAITKNQYFPNAIHIIDVFHVIKQLTEAINKIRNRVMKQQIKGTAEYNFMKKNWKLFLCSRNKIKDGLYRHKKTKKVYLISDLFQACLALDNALLEAYEILQDILKYYDKKDSKSIVGFINHNANLLINTNEPILIQVGKTYLNWLPEISNSLMPEVRNAKITNGIAEGFNNTMKTIIKISYGYNNFDRFRRRALIISQKKWKQ